MRNGHYVGKVCANVIVSCAYFDMLRGVYDEVETHEPIALPVSEWGTIPDGPLSFNVRRGEIVSLSHPRSATDMGPDDGADKGDLADAV